MSWFTSFFQQKEQPDNNPISQYLKEIFVDLKVQKEQLVSSKQPAVNRVRFLDLTNKLLLFKEDYTKEHAFQLEYHIKNVLEKIASFESSFKLFKFDDQQLLNHEKKVFFFLHKYVVNVLTLILKTNIEKHRISFLQQGKLIQTKFQQIQELHKQLQLQQEKAEVENSIKTQQEIEDLFEQCVILNIQRRNAASELLKEIKKVETRDKEQGESKNLQQELTTLSENCNSDLDTLLRNFEKLKNRLQTNIDEKAVVQKQEQRLKAAENHKQKMDKLTVLFEAEKAAQEKSFEELMKSVDEGKYIDVSILQTDQEYAQTMQQIEILQTKLLTLADKKKELESDKLAVMDEHKKVKQMLQDIMEISQQRVHNIEATVQVINQTVRCLNEMQTIATELDQFLTMKVEECDKLFRSYWLESLTEHVHLTCEMWTFLQVRILRKKKDIQHVSLDVDTIKSQLQDAISRENLTDVARFQKKKKKQENVLNEIMKELERLMNKQGDTMLNIHMTIDHLNQLNEPSYGAKIEALTAPPVPSVL